MHHAIVCRRYHKLTAVAGIRIPDGNDLAVEYIAQMTFRIRTHAVFLAVFVCTADLGLRQGFQSLVVTASVCPRQQQFFPFVGITRFCRDAESMVADTGNTVHLIRKIHIVSQLNQRFTVAKRRFGITRLIRIARSIQTVEAQTATPRCRIQEYGGRQIGDTVAGCGRGCRRKSPTRRIFRIRLNLAENLIQYLGQVFIVRNRIIHIVAARAVPQIFLTYRTFVRIEIDCISLDGLLAEVYAGRIGRSIAIPAYTCRIPAV